MTEDRYVKDYIERTMRQTMMDGGVMEHVHRVESGQIGLAIERAAQMIYNQLASDVETTESARWGRVVEMARDITVHMDKLPSVALKDAQQFWDYIESIEQIAKEQSEET